MITEAFGRVIDVMRRRKHAYNLTFGTVAAGEVLIDLARFCRANETCFHEDARLHAVAEGRREVWLRIQQHLHLTSAQLAQLYSGANINTQKEVT